MEMTPERWRATETYAASVFGRQDGVLEAAREAARSSGLPDIAVSPEEGRLLMILASLTPGRLAVEVGTLGGYSGIWITRGLAADGRLITIEVDRRHAEVESIRTLLGNKCRKKIERDAASFCRDAIAHWQRIAPRPPRHGELTLPLPAALSESLASRGIEKLYTHQVRAIEALRGGLDVVVVTGTASGKSLCYHLPVLERLLADPEATALYLFPTKALAQDQLKGLTRLAAGHPDLVRSLVAGVYDGDTRAATRRKLRDSANVILSNPDMLHQGVLPAHSKWVRFLSRLSFVVVDEMHAYRGIFGSHVANVMRRLARLAAHYGARPRFVLCSATIRNPAELAGRLTGRAVRVVDDDGAPRGEKHFVFWNPPFADAARVERRSSNGEGCALTAGLLEAGGQVITFTKSRVAAELVYRYARERLQRIEPGLEDRIRPYRGGYLPEERRRIEQALFSGTLRGVVCTNALELGIDVGGLDAAVLIGAPPTLASAWQQVGRAGRGGEPSLAVLVAYNDTVDQYLMRHPDYFFGRSPEAAIIDPHNPYILAQQTGYPRRQASGLSTDSEK